MVYTIYYIPKGWFSMTGSRTVRVNRWGNGLGIRLPKEFIDRAGITESSRVDVRPTDDGLLITHIEEPRKHIPLAERLQGWSGQPYELSDEDAAWVAMQAIGDEL
jgi:antitoxin component of MazEF toxin-antitoxin module